MVYDCNFFVFDIRLFSNKCWLKTGKSLILPPVAGTIFGPKHCDGYQIPNTSNIGNAYDVPVPKHNIPKENYKEPEAIYKEPDYKGIPVLLSLHLN